MTWIPWSIARPSTGSRTSASFGTTPITSTFWAMRSSTARTCSAGSALVGPTMKASTPSSSARSRMPASIALNHGIPPILTTTPMVGVSWAMAGAPATSAAAAAALMK